MHHAHPHLLEAFPLSRASTVQEACERVGRIFSPHRLELRGAAQGLDLHHNQVRLRELSLNTLSYGADVLIDPGERGDFFMVQLPLAGHAAIVEGCAETRGDTRMLTVLQPRQRCRMLWSGDCRMILLQVPRDVVERRAAEWGRKAPPRFASARSRQDPEVAAWWQAVEDLTCNLDRHGPQWMRHPAACAAMEEFLLSAFTAMLSEPEAASAGRGDERCLRRAKEYIHGHLDRALSLPEIARHAGVSPRTLEAAFKRQGEPTPVAYARRQRLAAVHRALRAAAQEGRAANVTEVALAHGFLHLGRFAAQYRAQFGCAPSQTLRLH